MPAPTQYIIALMKAADDFIERQDEASRRAFYRAFEGVKRAELEARALERRRSARNLRWLLLLGGVILVALLIVGLVLLRNAQQFAPLPTLLQIPSATVTLSPTATATTSATLTVTSTMTPSATPSASDTPTASSTLSATPSETVSATASASPTGTATPSATQTLTATHKPTATRTATRKPPTATASPVPVQVNGVKLAVNPASYSGPCPAQFAITAQVSGQGNGVISYRWERSDGTTGNVMTASVAAPWTLSPGDSWSVNGSGSRTESLHILAPLDRTDKVAFTANCATPTPPPGVVGVKASVSPQNYKGLCPETFTFTGDIVTSGPLTVTYRWERSDGASSATQTLVAGSSGDQTVQTTWTLGAKPGDNYAGFEILHVLMPNELFSNKTTASFAEACTQ